jgi:hypothetical protein
MRILTSRSARFTRSLNYTLPEYRPSAPRGMKTQITVVAPLGRETSADVPAAARVSTKR